MADILLSARLDLVVLGIGGDVVIEDDLQPGLDDEPDRLVDPAGGKQPLVAHEEDLVPAEATGTGADLVQQAPAENDLGYFEFAVVQCALACFHFHPHINVPR